MSLLPAPGRAKSCDQEKSSSHHHLTTSGSTEVSEQEGSKVKLIPFRSSTPVISTVNHFHDHKDVLSLVGGLTYKSTSTHP